MTELLPCPFCGDTPESESCSGDPDTGPFAFIECVPCGIKHVADTANAVRKGWNSRAANPIEVTDAVVEAAVSAWNDAPVKAHGHLISNRFEHEQMKAAITAALKEANK